MSPDFAEVEQWVLAEIAASRQSGIVDITEVVAHPTQNVVACTVSIRTGDDAEPSHQVALVDVEKASHHVLDLGSSGVHLPTWSLDGRLAVVAAGAEGVDTALIVESSADSAGAEVLHRLPEVAGAVESVAWSPTGDRLVLVVAQFGAEVSDVYGSGTVQGPAGAESWRPIVTPAPEVGRRIVHVWDPSAGTVESLVPALNAWEVAWFGPDRLLILASEGAGEGAWYSAELVVVDLAGERTPLHRSDVQLAQPSANPSGTRWSVLESRASDRGLLSGNLLVGEGTAPAKHLATANVDVSGHIWRDENRIGFGGLRGLDTVFGIVDVPSGHVDEVLVTDGSSGLYQPEAGAWTDDGDLVVVLERHGQPPTLTAARDDVRRELISTAGAGTAHVAARCGRTERRSWTSLDGREIQGLVTLPDGDGPFPLVVNVHGGPVAAWSDGWIGKDDYASLLVARGFAVLRPNIRGSTGRGQDFIEAIVGGVGGADVDDVTFGVQSLIDEGIAEAGRIGLTGNSYGGYMAAWIPCVSDLFAASISRSPVTDFFSQHFTANLAEFDDIFIDGDPFDRESQYWTRNTLTHHRRIKTPMLFTAGKNDLATPPSQAQMLHRALLEAGVPTELVIYPEEGHGVRAPAALADQIARMIVWFETYLGDGRAS